MEKTQINEQAVKDNLIQAAKDILKTEGLKGIGIHSVSYRAGYSNTIFYNYFKDINELISITIKDFRKQCSDFIKDKTEKTTEGKEKLRYIAESYVEYFIEYPGIFELIFLDKIEDNAGTQQIYNEIYNFLDELTEREWYLCELEGFINSENVAIKKKQLHALLIGLVLFYERRNQPDNYDDFIDLIKSQLDSFFNW